MSELILFVEDNADFRDSAARFLELNGYEVLVAGDGVEALELLEECNRTPHIIVSDISMPRMNGYEFFKKVREQRQFIRVPFLFLTALDARADMRLGWEVGVDEYLVKPFRPEDFLAVVKSRIQRMKDVTRHLEKEIIETRTMIVRILSHELRTPLTYVTGGFTLLADEINKQGDNTPIDREDVETILNLIHSGTDRLNRLAEQMVLLAELMSTQSNKDWASMFQPVNLADVVESAVAQLHAECETHQVTIEIEDMTPMEVSGIHNLLLTAIVEPLRNAIQYSEQGDTVWVRSYEHNTSAVVEIVDEGRGIPAKDLDNIWELMSQSERDKYEQQGFGLGLPITRQIIQIHQGDTKIESKFGSGTQVRLMLPLDR